MAEENFFKLFKEKLATLQPSVRHRANDWASLSERLDQAMPHRPPNRRLAWLPFFIFFILLFSSNVFWWLTYRDNKAALMRMETGMAGMATGVAELNSGMAKSQKDTVWKTIYVRVPYFGDYYLPKKTWGNENAFGGVFNQDYSMRSRGNVQNWAVNESEGVQEEKPGNTPINTNGLGRLDANQDTVLNKAPTQPLETLALDNFIAYTPQAFPSFGMDVLPVQKRYKPVKSILYSFWGAVKPKELKVGANAGWVNPVSPGLIHEVGFEYGAQGVLGFSRHWSVLFEYSYTYLHYEADDLKAILGSPNLPSLPSPEHYYAHLDINRQSVWQYGLGIRHTFSPLGKLYPFAGLNWGNQTVSPFSIAYEVHHDPSSSIQQGNYTIGHNTRVRNILRFNAGLEIPLSRRLGLSLEGYYLRPWSKANATIFDMAGIRVGANWIIF